MTEKKIKIIKDGPYQVSGDVPLAKETIVEDTEGYPINWQKGEEFVKRENYTLCRCGHSKNKPYCDGSHVKAGFKGEETAGFDSFKNQAQITEGPELTLSDASGFCIGAGFCDRAGGTWDLVKKSDDQDSRKTAIIEACNCPSGRLVVSDKKSGKAIEPKFEKSISLIENADGTSGPLWIKGGIPIESAEGKEYEKRNRVTLCRCGRSKNKPFCDGSHMVIEFSDKN